MPPLQFFKSPRTKVIAFIIIFLSLTIGVTFLIKSYFINSINESWNNISIEKTKGIKEFALELFETYQKNTLEFSDQLVSNKKITSALNSQNVKKTYEALYDINDYKDYNIEIYNSRLELFSFSGRQINPDISDLTKAFNGQRFSSVKEIGFYTYSVVYSPIKSDSTKRNQNSGVIVTAKLIDIKYGIKNKFFQNFGLTFDIFNKFGTPVDFVFKTNPAQNIVDTSKEEITYPVKNINSESIGIISIPRPDKSSYIQEVTKKFSNLISVELFFLAAAVSVLLFLFVYKNKNSFPSWLNVVLNILILIAFRYILLLVGFPEKLFNEFNVEIFSPVFYASNIAFGIARSIGELLITSVLASIGCYLIVTVAIDRFKAEVKSKNTIQSIIFIVLSLIIFLMTIQVYGDIIQSLVYDSNLQYFDRNQIISTSKFELLCVQFIILLLSICLLTILLSCSLVVIKYLKPFLSGKRVLAKNNILILYFFILGLSFLLEVILPAGNSFSLKLSLRNLLIILSGLLTLFVHRQILVNKNYKFTSVLNFSILILICIIFIPSVLLNKITSRENKYIELIARKISEQVNDKISFNILSSLEDVADNRELESDVVNKNKFAKLAFNVWSDSKLSSENLNSAVFILDTSKKLISDFNINPTDLVTDSVVSFAVRSLSHTNKDNILEEQSDVYEDDIETDNNKQVSELLAGDEILENKEMKFYCGIRPIERSNLKDSKYRNILGYVIIAAAYDSKNFLPQSNIEIFRTISRDNIENKLISTPVISEFSNGELTGSSDKEVSKAFMKSIDVFKESVVSNTDKTSWRYDEFQNEIYKSFYILINAGGFSNTNPEKIYIVSSKVSDFTLMTFFIFKYLLFTVLVYVIFLFFYMVYKGIKFFKQPVNERRFQFGFREKIFASFFIVSVIPIIILALLTRDFVKTKNNDFYNNQIISDLKVIDQYVKSKLSLENIKKTDVENHLTFSNLFGKNFAESHKNFNLFIKSQLLSTTNEELYKSDLLDTRISGNAFYNIVLLKKDYFVENQQIGTFNFIVGYKPIFDNNNNLIGIVSSQTVFKQNEINQELTENLVYIFGTYFIAVIFLILIVNILSYRISNPVIKLLRATEQLSKGNVEIQVKSESRDEIGELVTSFNKMTRELKRSRNELKKAERESAWRDIARQVAHEIKNPLTPMKLAMQHLYHAYNRKSKDFQSILQKTNQLIIDQIETLNKIATEFSDFAKMPSRNYEPLEINTILADAVNLFNADKRINFTEPANGNGVKVIGDKDELKRAFINIIRNALQATDEDVPAGKKQSVVIETAKNNSYYYIKIKDNGVGMDDVTLQKLFEPYFSTKSKGMGLGLVITKKIIDDMKGKISVTSEVNKGTEVQLKFKIEQEEDE